MFQSHIMRTIYAVTCVLYDHQNLSDDVKLQALVCLQQLSRNTTKMASSSRVLSKSLSKKSIQYHYCIEDGISLGYGINDNAEENPIGLSIVDESISVYASSFF